MGRYFEAVFSRACGMRRRTLPGMIRSKGWRGNSKTFAPDIFRCWVHDHSENAASTLVATLVCLPEQEVLRLAVTNAFGTRVKPVHLFRPTASSPSPPVRQKRAAHACASSWLMFDVHAMHPRRRPILYSNDSVLFLFLFFSSGRRAKI